MKIEKIHTCTGHRASIYALTTGKDGRHFRSAGGDGWVVEWNLDDPETGRLVASVDNRIFSMCALDKQRLVAGNMDGGVHWINLNLPDATRNIQHHQKGVFDILQVDEWVFTAGGDGVLTRWNADKGSSVESFQLSAQALRAIAFSPETRELAVGASDHTIYLLDADTLDLKRTLQGAHTNSVFTLAYTPDGHQLLSGGRDAMLRVWAVREDYRLLSEQPAHLFTLNHIVFSPDGSLFATASRDKTLKIWDSATFQLLKVVDTLRYGAHINSVNRLLWLPDCLVSCSDDRSVMLWRVVVN